MILETFVQAIILYFVLLLIPGFIKDGSLATFCYILSVLVSLIILCDTVCPEITDGMRSMIGCTFMCVPSVAE